MVAQFTTEIKTEIAYSYVDFDGLQVDVVSMTYPNGLIETRQMWTEGTLNEPEYNLKTSNGKAIKLTPRTKNNKWLSAYQQMCLTRWQSDRQLDTCPTSDELYEIEIDRAYQEARSDLGFGWY